MRRRRGNTLESGRQVGGHLLLGESERPTAAAGEPMTLHPAERHEFVDEREGDVQLCGDLLHGKHVCPWVLRRAWRERESENAPWFRLTVRLPETDNTACRRALPANTARRLWAFMPHRPSSGLRGTRQSGRRSAHAVLAGCQQNHRCVRDADAPENVTLCRQDGIFCRDAFQQPVEHSGERLRRPLWKEELQGRLPFSSAQVNRSGEGFGECLASTRNILALKLVTIAPCIWPAGSC